MIGLHCGFQNRAPSGSLGLMWTHRPITIGGQRFDNDREVLRDGVRVGRVYFAPNFHPPDQWVWVAGVRHGRAETMGAALEAVRRAVLG